jgi:hypothetical protein
MGEAVVASLFWEEDMVPAHTADANQRVSADAYHHTHGGAISHHLPVFTAGVNACYDFHGEAASSDHVQGAFIGDLCAHEGGAYAKAPALLLDGLDRVSQAPESTPGFKAEARFDDDGQQSGG